MAKVKFWKGIGNFFKRLFSKSKAAAEKYIPIGIEVVELLKQVLDSPVTPILTMLIPGQLDDVLAARVKALLPQVLATMKITNECAKKTTPDEIVQCAIAYLKTLHPEVRHEFWLTIAAKISAALSDGVLTWHEIMDITQDVYDNEFK